jgi:hypothetical protein
VNGDDGEPHRGRNLEIAVAAAGILLMAFALLARQSWWDRHFLPVFFFSHEKYVLAEKLVRLAAVLAGFFLVMFAGPMTARKARRMPVRAIAAAGLRILVAIGLALAVTELTMRHEFAFAAAEAQPGEEPVRQPDARLGWIFKPAHDGRSIAGKRLIAYSIDRLGYRVRDQKAPVDLDAPSIVFTGESIIAGYGLNWDETIPAQTGAALGIQSASIAVFGYANDQAYLRLVSELPRFHRPVAIVSLFIPSLFPRNLGDDRPHLDAKLRWAPAVHRLWLTSLFRFLIPYHTEAEIEQGIEATRGALLATAAMARRHGAIALVVDPQFGPESPAEQMLRHRILDEPAIAYVRVPLDPSWHLKGDLHPDPRAARVIALAIAARLRADLPREARRDVMPARQSAYLPPG